MELEVRGNNVINGIVDITAIIKVRGKDVYINHKYIMTAKSESEAKGLAETLWASLDAWT